MKKDEFPKTIYVNQDGSPEDIYLIANESVEDSDDGLVAEYQLVKVGTKTTETKYV